MFLKTLSFLACGGLAVAGLRLADSGCPGARVLAPACTSASLDDKKDDKDKPALSGAWVKKEGELKIVFVGKNMMSIYPHGENKVLVIECECTPGKDGLVKAKVTGFDGKDEAKKAVMGHLPVGSEFAFKWKLNGDTGTLDELKSEKADVLKSRLEGKYEQKK